MFYAPEDVRMEDVRVPEPGPGEILVRIEAALTCGTDVKSYKRGHPTLFKTMPSPFGHEFAGEIEAVGDGVEDWNTGMRVVAANSAPCNRCYYCKVGDQSMSKRSVRRIYRGAEPDRGSEPLRDTGGCRG
jgi:L-iditol 2-dehydrogenase